MTRNRFFQLHERLAMNYDRMADTSDAKYGTASIRQSILKFASGVGGSD